MRSGIDLIVSGRAEATLNESIIPSPIAFLGDEGWPTSSDAGPISPDRWHWPRPFLLALVIGVGSFLVVLSVVPAGLGVGALARVVRATTSAPLRIPRLPQRSTIYAADGSVLGKLYLDYDRQSVPLRQVRPLTRKAVLAIEDHAFFQHGPIYLPSILRAALADLRARAFVQGGSTIAQQLVKDTVTGGAVTISRKVREAEDAIRLERTYTKKNILQMYLNEVYLGHGVYGIGAAAEYYFGESVGNLDLEASAVLAGMIASPEYFDPIDHPGHALARRDRVLRRMRALGWITTARLRQAVAEPIQLSANKRHAASPAPRSYWEQFVVGAFLSDPAFGKTYRRRLHELYQGGLKIYTTLEPSLQHEARIAIENRMGAPGLPQSAVVSIVPQTGAIVTMAVGNWPFASHRYNLATDPGGGRTAGSAFKGFTLAAALRAGVSPDAVYNGDSPRTIANCGGGETWTVHNAEPGSGDYPLWLATADSVNVVFAQLIDQVGPDAVARVAHLMGITSPLVPVCPLTLGTSPVSPLEMTSGYATLANDGVHCRPYAIARVVSSTGKTIYRATRECSRALPSSVAEEETALLEGVVRFGTGTAANIGRPQAGKTGTGDNYQDAWFVGYVPQLATGVWVGYAEAEVPMPAVPGYGAGFGGVLAAPIWHDYMIVATRGMPVLEFPAPPFAVGPLAAPTPSPSPTLSTTPSLTPAPSPSPT